MSLRAHISSEAAFARRGNFFHFLVEFRDIPTHISFNLALKRGDGILRESIDRTLQRRSERGVVLQDELEVLGEFLDALGRLAGLLFVAGYQLL